jgi:hypothetical protein
MLIYYTASDCGAIESAIGLATTPDLPRVLPRLEWFEAQVFEEGGVKVIAAMVPAPLGFFKMEKEEFGAHATQLSEAELGKAPEALNAIDVVFAARKFVLMMVDAPVFIAA